MNNNWNIINISPHLKDEIEKNVNLINQMYSPKVTKNPLYSGILNQATYYNVNSVIILFLSEKYSFMSIEKLKAYQYFWIFNKIKF